MPKRAVTCRLLSAVGIRSFLRTLDLSQSMGRLKVEEAPQRGRRWSSSTVKRKAKPTRAAGACRATIKKSRTFLTPSEQALLIVEYLELPAKKKGSDARFKALVKLCKK